MMNDFYRCARYVTRCNVLLALGMAILVAHPLIAQVGGTPARGTPTRDTTAIAGAAAMMRDVKPDKTIVLLLYDGFAALDVAGPAQMLGGLWSKGYRVSPSRSTRELFKASPESRCAPTTR